MTSPRSTTAGKSAATWQRAVMLVLAATLMFACLDATNKHLVKSYPVPMIAWARYFFHLLTFGVLVLFTHRQVALRTNRLGLHVARSLLLVGVSSPIPHMKQHFADMK